MARRTKQKRRRSHQPVRRATSQLTWKGRLLVMFLAIFIPPFVSGHTPRDIYKLTEALYWEGAVQEPFLGLRAIASIITNRAESNDYPDSVYRVVTAQDRGQTTGGCAFSYRCDKLEGWTGMEHPRLMRQVPRVAQQIERDWGGTFGYEARWLMYSAFAWFHLSIGEHLYDPTDNATLYWTGRNPYWIVDCIPSSIARLGSHHFCRSRWLGDDL